MILEIFKTAADLQKFCVTEGILQTQIVQIWVKDNQWHLFYY